MTRILSLIMCVALASTAAAAPKHKADKEARKAAKRAEKAERKWERGRGKKSRFRPEFREPNIVERRVLREPERTVVREYRSDDGFSYEQARRLQHRHGTRDRDWWRSRYNRFALFAGGYYYWDGGYWYPAYGYDSRYSTYRYDEPIYGYNAYEPGRVIRNVQIELRRRGYYRGGIDGLIGPMTRRALAQYQRDRGLYVTRAIDGATLRSLGLG